MSDSKLGQKRAAATLASVAAYVIACGMKCSAIKNDGDKSACKSYAGGGGEFTISE